ncbi:sensor histidine kinase [Ectopseudomonas khazarica]|uniref:sensor histidine kinase n=1 Tax=Ectopseudomonas khazarica TaxID=2502979 RepID=UPI0015CD4FF7
MALDFNTILLMMAVISLVSAIALYSLYRLLPEPLGLEQAAIAGACQAVTPVLLLARGIIDPMISILLSNAAYFLACAFYYQAVRRLCDLAMEWRWPLTIMLISYPLIIVFLDSEDLSKRVFISSLAIGCLTFMSSWVLWKGQIQLSRRGLAIIFAIATLLCVIRVLLILAQPDFRSAYLIFMLGIVTSIGVAIGIVVIVFEHLREQLKLQLQKITAAHDIARIALREQKNFMTMLSHEFKTPLSIIKANADAVIMIDNPPAPFIKKSLERIQQTSLRLNSLVDGCLSEERISTAIEKNELFMASLDLVELLSDLSQEYGVRFVNTQAPAALHIQGDRYLVSILFSNLISNARKFARTHENVEIRLLSPSQHHTAPITVEVFDDGQGIAEQERKRIFDKYYRVLSETQQPGSGLGLFFVKRIVDLHGGIVSVECGQGTIFSVTLPVEGAAGCNSYAY